MSALDKIQQLFNSKYGNYKEGKSIDYVKTATSLGLPTEGKTDEQLKLDIQEYHDNKE
jgi:hypothetical protein